MGRRSRTTQLIATYTLLTIGASLVVAPFFIGVLGSLKTLGEITQVPPTVLPSSPKWGNYPAVFDAIPLGRQLLNTTVIAVARILGQLLIGSACAFALARLRFRGRRMVLVIVLSLLMMPAGLLLIPQYEIMSGLGWLDTLQAAFAPGMFLPFGVFLLYQFFRTLPMELDEAARLDGCNPFQVYLYIALPLMRPALVALAIITAVWSWNDFLWPLIVLNSSDVMPVSVGLSLLQGQFVTNYPLQLAGAVMATAPVIILFVVMQKQFINGFTASGIK